MTVSDRQRKGVDGLGQKIECMKLVGCHGCIATAHDDELVSPQDVFERLWMDT